MFCGGGCLGFSVFLGVGLGVSFFLCVCGGGGLASLCGREVWV